MDTSVSHRVVVLDSSVRINDLEVPGADIAESLRAVPAQEQELTVIKALQVGVFCLERGRVAQNMDFVKRHIADLLMSVEHAVGTIPTVTQEELVAKIGMGDGQVLAPIKQLLGHVSAETTARVNEVKTLLAQDLDPSKTTSTIGSALQKIREMLDPARKDSVQGILASSIGGVASADGALAKTVKTTVEEAIRPIRQEVNNLATAVHGQDLVAEALQQTPQKGAPYEEDVAACLQPWAKAIGAQVQHVGVDNQPGDFIVDIGEGSMAQERIRIVVEARDRQARMGVQRLSQDLAVKIAERKADCGVYVSKTPEGLAKEVGDWCEGSCEKGAWVACVHEHLTTALRFLTIQQRLKKVREAAPEVDAALIQNQVGTIRTTLGRVKTINTKLTNLRGCAGDIGSEAEELRKEINAALTAIEDALRAKKAAAPPTVPEQQLTASVM